MKQFETQPTKDNQFSYYSLINTLQKLPTLEQHKPFQMITNTRPNTLSNGNNINQNPNFNRNQQFRREDLHRNSLAYSEDTNHPNLKKSEVLSQIEFDGYNALAANNQDNGRYLYQKETEQFVQFPVNNQHNDIQELRYLNASQNSNPYFKNVFTGPQNLSSQKLLQQFNQIDHYSTDDNNQSYSDPLNNNIFSTQNPYHQSATNTQSYSTKTQSYPTNTQSYPPIDDQRSYNYRRNLEILKKHSDSQELHLTEKSSEKISFEKQNDQNLNQMNEEISEVKYRLDELMKKFPATHCNSLRREVDFRKKQSPSFQISGPQLPSHRPQSIQEHKDGNYLQFSSPQKEGQHHYGNPHTEETILIQQSNSQSENHPQLRFNSEYVRIKKLELRPGTSLNYSQSGANGSGQEIMLPNLQVESLYQQIHEQEEAIATYKQIIFRLENQNMHLVRVIKSNPHSMNNSIHDKENNQQEHHHNLTIGIQNSKSQSSSLKKSLNPPSDQFHKFQRQESLTKQTTIEPTYQLQFPQPSPRVKTSGKIRLSLQQQVEMLESQKLELLNKIDWLNSIVEEMMTMGNKVKSDKSETPDISESHRNKGHSRTPSNKIYEKASKILQTSFVDPITQSLDQFNFKRLYEKEVEYQQRMKEQINDLQSLQEAYAQQFQMILKEIAEIKQNRNYYQQLKLEIKKQKEHSLNKKQSPSVRNQSVHKKIFQNHLIYQLKSENQMLKSKYEKLKQQRAKQKMQMNKPTCSIITESNASNRNPSNNHEDSFVVTSVINEEQKKNIFTARQLKNNRNFNQRDSRISIFDKLKKRPASFGELYFQKNSSSEKRMSFLKNRKNGTIYCLSQEELQKNNANTPAQGNRGSNIKDKINSRLNQSSNSRLQGSYANKKSNFVPRDKFNSSILLDSSLGHRIHEEKQKSSNCTQETNQNMISRYNNFIKNMKKRFGINSSIIGKEVTSESLQFGINSFQAN